MPYSQYTFEEVERRAEAIYAQIRPLVEPTRHGEHVVIDIESGDYEIDPDDAAATIRLMAKHPNAVMFGLRVGYPTAYTLGGHSMTEMP